MDADLRKCAQEALDNGPDEDEQSESGCNWIGGILLAWTSPPVVRDVKASVQKNFRRPISPGDVLHSVSGQEVENMSRADILRALTRFDGGLGFRAKQAANISLADLLRCNSTAMEPVAPQRGERRRPPGGVAEQALPDEGFNSFGWLSPIYLPPDRDIRGNLHGGDVYVHGNDIKEPRLGSIYTFTLYSDRQGFGAQECEPRSVTRFAVPMKSMSSIRLPPEEARPARNYLRQSLFYPALEEQGITLRRYLWGDPSGSSLHIFELWGHPEAIITVADQLNLLQMEVLTRHRMCRPNADGRGSQAANRVCGAQKNVYCDGIFDLCHIGHQNLFRNASKLGTHVWVGVVGDKDANSYKRPPIMTAAEREAQVLGCKHVDRVIPNALCFGMTEEFLKEHDIHVCAVGQEYFDRYPNPDDDPYYKVPRKMGIAVPLPRFEGLSTSDLIRRIRERASPDWTVSSLPSPTGDALGTRASDDYHRKECLSEPRKNVYCDGIFDMCHIGHQNLFRNASKLGTHVFVGVVGDKDANSYKRPPIMTAAEREAQVLGCKDVDRVIPNALCFGMTEEFLKEHDIHVCAVGQEYFDRYPNPDDDPYYKVPRKMGIAVPLPRFEGLSTSELIQRVQDRFPPDEPAK
ncbi:unnamed protein product [Durusdinium trenchii]|uniref:ethanolamine-phosphate cytidylyltransferase n=1 Tax=Durusdinium trenchii TaxID=1381693 RepID=A0ABP0SIJ2_9DINO